LKYRRLANVEVDVFPRLVGSSEWDTVAWQAVLEAAGGHRYSIGTQASRLVSYGIPNRRYPRLLALRASYGFTDFVLKHYQQELL